MAAKARAERIYLHEIIHIVGPGSDPYKRQTAQLGLGRTDGGAPLVGTFQQSGSTGDWPKVVNLWEIGGWDDWARSLEKQYTRASGQEPALRRWWTDATAHRSGGFDRILRAAPFSPTRAEILASGVRGLACLQEIATTLPGRAEDYLEALDRHWRVPARRRGLSLVGAWTTAMRDDEAVVLWCLPTFRDFTRHLSDVRTAPEARRWADRARRLRVSFRETLLVPSPWCIVHPDFRDVAPGPPARSRAAAPRAVRGRGDARR